MHRIGRHLVGTIVEGFGQHFEGKAGRQALHAFIDTGGVAVFLDGFGFRIDILEMFAVVGPHFGKQVGVFARIFESRQDRKLGQLRSVCGSHGASASAL